MKTKISHLGRSTVSVILAVMMLLSTMLIGTVSTVNATVSGLSEIYFTPSKNWADGNAKFRLNVQDSNNNWQNIKMTKVNESEPIYKGVIDSNTSYNVIQFLRYNSNDDAQWDSSLTCSSIPSGMNYYKMTTDTWNNWAIDNANGTWSYYSDSDPVADSVTLTANPTSVKAGKPVTLTPTVSGEKSNNLTYTYKKISGGTATEEKNADNSLSVTPSEAGTYKYTVTVSAEGFSDVTSTDVSFEVTEDASVVTDTRLISVLDGSKVMFYGGEDVNWGQDIFYAMTSNSTSSAVDSASMSGNITIGSTEYEFALLCVPRGTYYLGHWESGLSTTVSAGDTFIVWGNSGISGYTKVTGDGNCIYKPTVIGTTTADTTLSDNEVATGGLLGVTTSTSAGSSSLGFDNTFEYYVRNTTTKKFYKVALSDGKLDTSAFTDEGEYEVKTVLKDAKGLYVLADSDNFVISNKAKYSVTFGSNDVNMGAVSVSDGTNSYTTSPASVEEDKSVTFTATAENGYKFDGWYRDADCTTAIENAAAATYTTTVTADTTVYAKFVAETYNITVNENTNCTVTVNETAEYGSTVSVTVKANAGYTVKNISVTNVNDSDITGNATSGFTFKMPASDVVITPNVKAVDVTAPKVTLNTVAGESTASISVKENYPITASKKAGDAYSQITSTDFSVSGGVEGTDYTKTETFEGSGIYNFVALTKGTFTVTYTATATSINDNTKSTSATATLKITASYTDTQNAYLALSKCVDEVKDTTSDGYTTDSYAAFSAALTFAQTLLKGLPKADATNASDYTNAKTALETAFIGLEKDVTYYIGGRFKGQKWSSDTKTMPFAKVEGKSNLYKYETKMTVSQLSATVSSDNNQKQYFFIHTGKGRDQESYYASESSKGYNFHYNTFNNQLSLKKHTAGTDEVTNYIKFDNTSDSSSNVVLYLDTSDKDNFKLYYSADIEPDYRITGTLANAGGWSHKFASSMKFDTLETDGSYSKEVSISDADITSGKNYFRLINNDTYYDDTLKENVNKEYGPYTETGKVNTDVNICDFNTKAGAYGTYWNNGTAFYFKDAGTYKIHYIYNTTKSAPDIWVEKVSIEYNVTVDSGVSATVDKAKAAKGEKVTITATPESGKVLDSVTVKAAENTQVTTTVSGNTATFTMPAQNVTVTKVTFRDANKYTVNFSSSDPTNGKVSAQYNGADFATGTKVTEGDTVTFTATPISSGYTFKDWTVKVNGTEKTYTYSSLPLKITADTTVVANFKVEDSGTPSGYYILWGTDASFSKYEAKELYLKDDGKYYANFDAKTDKIGQNENYYFVFSTSNTTSGVKPEQTNVTINEVVQNKFYFQSNNSDISGVGSTRVPKIWNESADLLGFKIIVSDIVLNDKKVTYSCEPTFDVAPADTVEITAKDGTIRDGFTDKDGKKTTAVLGDTELSITTHDNKKIDALESYPADGKNRAVTAKKVPNGSTVTVTTKINPDATFAGHSGSDYYVKGFSVNGIFGGVLSQTDGKNHSGDEYTYTFTVDQEIYDSSKLEITPVYFLKNDENCVYFYIENYDSAKQIWGNTPSCYVYYGSGTTTLEALGFYPGQPMVDYNGSIFTQIPKYIDNGGTTPVSITGMTLNNYVWDDVHKAYSKKEQAGNAQTYDYDDFVKIADSGVNTDNIIYRFKYNTFDNEPADTFADSKADDAGWEVFLDYQNYPTDIFGNKIGNEKLDYKDTDKVTSQDKYLSIISNGYQNNYIGKYATDWSIYYKDGNRVATIPSSALLYALGKTDEQMTTAINFESTPTDFLPGKSNRDSYWITFKNLYKEYKNVPARINFEAAIQGGDDPGNRLDGRWYYSQSQQKITGEIKIQYANTLDDYKVGDFQDDKFADDKPSSIVGTTTGASAYFTDPYDRVRILETDPDNAQDYKFEVEATSTATYTFVGWYRLIDGDYKAINPSNMSSSTGAVTRNSDVTLVARYIKTPGGSMTFHHSLYNGTNAGGGKATTEIQVVVKDRDGKSLYDSDRIAGTASIDKNMIADFAKQEGLTVTVTLYTTTKNLYNFNGYYSAENTTDITAFAPTTGFTTNVSGDRTDGLVTTSEYTFSFNDYYTKYSDILTADAGTVYYNFYSDITSIKVPYKVQFSYTDRTGAQKYYNKAGYVDPENTSSYTFVENATNVEGVESHSVKVTLTNSFILSLAPYESNFTKNLTWDENSISNTPFDSLVTNSIASAVVKSTQSDKKIHLNVFLDKNTKRPTSRDNENGVFEFFTKDGLFEFPYGSVFYEKKPDGTYNYDITAPKTYEGKQFMYWAIYSDSRCRNEDLVIKAYNSEGHFSYVAYDNCWIVPVYGESSTPVASVKDVSTSTQFMEVTRNQWTADKNSNFEGFNADSMTTLDKADDFIKIKGEDKLYADFVLNFFYNGKQLSVFDPYSKNVNVGVLIQRLDLDENETGTGYITDLDYYANKKFTTEQLDAAEKDAIDKITTGDSVIKSVKQPIANSKLDNKNRLQYYTLFNNVKGNNNCVFRLYTYIQYTDADGNSAVKLSDPVYFTFYDIANKS